MIVSQLNYNDYASYDEFEEECYKIYLNAWSANPTFNKKPIYRNTNITDKEKEADFWSIVEGHNECRVFEHLERYITIPFFKYVLSNVQNSLNGETDDIIWHTEQRNINIISKTYNYLIIVTERKEKCFFVTAFPISEKKKNKKIKAWEFEKKYNCA